MSFPRSWVRACAVLLGVGSVDAIEPWDTVRIPEVGEFRMLVLTPTVVELDLVTTKERAGGGKDWDFVDAFGLLILPEVKSMRLVSEGHEYPIRRLGFKRRTLYAPLGRWEPRIGNAIYLELPESLKAGAAVRFEDGDGAVSLGGRLSFEATYSPEGWSPLVHVNEVGYARGFAKIAKVGGYLGSLGELDLAGFNSFYVRNSQTGEIVFRGEADSLADSGFGKAGHPYHHVLHLDFTPVDAEGVYVVGIEGVGESSPFPVSDGYWACLARTYALGTLHQRCGAELGEPFTRFTHSACHTAPAEIPAMETKFARAQELIRNITGQDAKGQRAPELSNVATSLYPFVKGGAIDVSGGHHDAGDYSKYTINSALFVNSLVTAVDVFPGVGALDNLGLPESGDGISDLLQIAKWEGDFLAKMQDDDGGFYFLVYPKERAYEDDVIPDKGDAQIVFPKNTSATAAASAALAQIGSSPAFRKAWPGEAAKFIGQAEKGWEFLEGAWKKHGREGAYQTISHYGDEFMDADEIAWAATELYLATGEKKYHDMLLARFNPGEESTHRWNWVRQFEGYGAAARSYAFGERGGRVAGEQLDRAHLRACVKEMLARADDLQSYTDASAYGVAFPLASKNILRVGWFIAAADAFDMAAMAALGKRDTYERAIVSNLDFELGANPNNMTFVTGLGRRRQFEIVHQWARNDHFALPMSGLPLGSLQDGLPWIPPYEGALGQFSFPSDGDGAEPYGIYDRWSDTFNTATEFVNVQQARSLAVCAAYMARTVKARQPWKAAPLQIVGLPRVLRAGDPVELSLKVSDPKLVLDEAFVVWETRGRQPVTGSALRLVPEASGTQWISVEAQWTDGRRAFHNASFMVTRRDGGKSIPADQNTRFLLHADAGPGAIKTGAPQPGMPRPATITITGHPRYADENLGWMEDPSGAAFAFGGPEDSLRVRSKVQFDGNGFVLSGWFQFNKFPHGIATTDILTLGLAGATPLISLHFDKWLEPVAPRLMLGPRTVADETIFAPIIRMGEWQHIEITFGPENWILAMEGKVVATGSLADGGGMPQGNETEWELGIGGFEGFVDEVRVEGR
jgi:hypothetical protein